MPVDAAAPQGREAWDPNQVPYVRIRERTMDLMSHPCHETLRDWIQDRVMRLIAASDRSDNFVMPWIMRTRYIEVTMEELAIVPHHFMWLDRLLVQSLKNVLDRRTDLYRGIVREDMDSLERHQTQLSSLQIMHKLFMTFATTHSLCQYAPHMDIAHPKCMIAGMEDEFMMTVDAVARAMESCTCE